MASWAFVKVSSICQPVGQQLQGEGKTGSAILTIMGLEIKPPQPVRSNSRAPFSHKQGLRGLEGKAEEATVSIGTC